MRLLPVQIVRNSGLGLIKAGYIYDNDIYTLLLGSHLPFH